MKFKTITGLLMGMLLLFGQGVGKKSNVLGEDKETAIQTTWQTLTKDIVKQIQKKTNVNGVHLRLDNTSQQMIQSISIQDWVIEEVNLDHQRMRFTAKLTRLSFSGKPMLVKGRLIMFQKMPSVTQRIVPGQVIQESDLDWQLHEISPKLKNAVSKPEELLQKTPRFQNIEPGQLIQPKDLQKPVWVRRGDTVKLIYQKKSLTMEQPGKALENGGKGDTIRVRSLSNQKVIVGVVTAEKQVHVGQ